ncbi:MAG: FG-GAP repeat protein [Flavobacteriales bacterium]|nr:FG-GAP repeat protein [Flavobacteriales bacterium]
MSNWQRAGITRWIQVRNWYSYVLLSGSILGASSSHAQVWPEIILDTPFGLGPGSTFGHALDLRGPLLAVGAPGLGLGSTWPGAVYLYDRYEGGIEAWGLVGTLAADNPYPGAGFGTQVHWHGDMLLVSAPYDIHPGTGLATGAVYVFRQDHPQAGEWGLHQVIHPAALADGLGFGDRLLVHEDLLVVHAPGHDEDPLDGQIGSGAFHIFQQAPDGSFHPQHVITGNYLVPDSMNLVRPRTTGWMTIAGDVFAYSSRSGIVNRLEKDALYDAQLLPATPTKIPLSDTLGIQCTILNFVAVAATENHLLLDLHPFCTVEASRVVAYELIGNDSLQQTAVLMPDTTLPLNEWFGWGADLDTYMDVAVVGVRGDENFIPNGHVEVFRPGAVPQQDWERIAYLVQSDPGYGDQFGRAVAIWDDVVSVGAPFHGPLDLGKVYIFRDPTSSVAERSDPQDGLLVHPNPISNATTHLRLAGSAPEQGSFDLHAMDGRCLERGTYSNGTIAWRTRSPGTYLLRVQEMDQRIEARTIRLIVHD